MTESTSNQNSALLNLPGELVTMIFSPVSGCDVLDRMNLRRTCRALRGAVLPPTLPELTDPEKYWEVAVRLDLYACNRCRSLRFPQAVSWLMLNSVSWSPDYSRQRLCLDCTDTLARDWLGYPGALPLLPWGEEEWKFVH
ncbi:hypothetical protein PG996_002817 [Apiospora saccharicola]|uniref:F-box domain-containing protein n=1 Tax=Apiospora saccharicola TaxID=335842 RepID=A0ABR1WNJ0_9PEZI